MKFLYQSGFLIRVDRGQIPIGKKNGQIVTAQHQPYLAGVLLTDRRTGCACFLDSYNANVFLEELARIKGYVPKDYDAFQTSLRETIALFPKQEQFPILTIQNENNYLQGVNMPQRNSLLMRIFAAEFVQNQTILKRSDIKAINDRRKEEIV